MEKITEEVVIPQTERKPTSPLSPKRPRTDCMVTNNFSRKSGFEFPELLTFQRTEGSTSLPNTFQNTSQICTAEYGCEDLPREKDQDADAESNVNPITEVATSHDDDNTHTGLSEVSFITAERHFLHLRKVEQLPVIETDKLSSDPGHDAGGVLAESHTSDDTRADASTRHDCKPLGKSLEHEPPGGGKLPSGYDEYKRRGQNDSGKIHAVARSLSEPGTVICQSACAYEDALHDDAGIYNTRSQSAEVEESNQKGDERRFSENILVNREEEEAKSHIRPSDYRDSNSPNSNTEASPSGNLAEAGKNYEFLFPRWQSDVKENAAVCDGEIKYQVSKNGLSNDGNPPAAECAEGSIVSCDVILATDIMGVGTDTRMNLKIDDLCGAKVGNAAGKMIAEAGSEAADHTTETPMPARIRQEPIEGDNDAGPFTVIDPAIWSESDREFEGKCCNSESTAGVELSLSIAVSMMHPPYPLCGNRPEYNTKELSVPGQTGHFNSGSETQQCTGEKKDTCQSYTEPQHCSITTDETRDNKGNEAVRHWKFSPSSSPCRPVKPFPTGDRREESPGALGHLWKEQDQAGCLPVTLNRPKTQEVEYSQTEIATVDGIMERQGSEEESRFGEEMTTDVYLEKSKDRLLQQNRQHKADVTEMPTGNCISNWKECKTSKRDNKSTPLTEDERGTLLICFTDCRAETPMLENKDELLPSFTSLPPSDAVVPGPQDLSHECCSQHADNPTAQHCNDRFSPVPSAFVLPDRVPEGFDTFEKIQLLPDDDADDLVHSPHLTSLTEQLLKTSQRQPHHSTPGAESDDCKEIKEEEEEIECLSENMGNGFYNREARPYEVPVFISTTHLHTVEQQRSSQSASNFYEHYQADLNPQLTHSTVSTERDSPVPEASGCPEFEMKEQYNMVLEELSLYFEISTNDFPDNKVLTPQQHSVTTEAQSGNTSDCRERGPAVENNRHMLSDDEDDENRSLEICGSDPVDACTAGGCDREQEVPLDCSHHCQEASMYSLGNHREPRELEKKSNTWTPSFIFPSFLEQLSPGQPEPPRRLEPLRTCTRPIRVGLSKRAKTKQLHCPHPYK